MKKLIVLIPALALTACSLAPKQSRPAMPVPSSLPSASKLGNDSSATAVSRLPWFSVYPDLGLQRAIRLALQNNRDLRLAALNVERYQALYAIQRTALIPSLDAKGTGSRQRTPGDLSGTGTAITSDRYQVSAEIPSYELDFFGRVTSLRDQVLDQYLATEEAQRTAQISLVSAVVRQYLTWVALEEQTALAQSSWRSAQESFQLNERSFTAGVASELDLRTAEGQRESARAAVANLGQQAAQAKQALAVLLGVAVPDDLQPQASLHEIALGEVTPTDLSSSVLLERPDVKAAEHALRAANANIGVARAAFFPSIKLTAMAGTASADLKGLFEAGSGTWSFVPTVTVPIFAAGKNRALLKVAEIEKRQEVARYEKAIQTAFREVADALQAREFLRIQEEAQELRVRAAERRHDLATQRYRSGIDSYLSVLLAQQEQFTAEQARVQARLARMGNTVALYAALGGGSAPTEDARRIQISTTQ